MNPSTINLISKMPLHFSRVTPRFSKIITKTLLLKYIYKRPLNPHLTPKTLYNLSFYAPNDLGST